MAEAATCLRYEGQDGRVEQQQHKGVKKELLSFATAWMALETIMVNEISQLVKDKYHIISPIRGI